MLRIKLDYSFSRSDEAARGAALHLDNPLFVLLSAIRRTGSIGKAAKSMGYSYRHVWGELKRWETELQHELIVWEKGRRARLSPFGDCFNQQVSLPAWPHLPRPCPHACFAPHYSPHLPAPPQPSQMTILEGGWNFNHQKSFLRLLRNHGALAARVLHRSLKAPSPSHSTTTPMC